MAHTVHFEDLPTSSRSPSAASHRYSETAQILKSKPMKWARILQRARRGDAATTAYQIRKGILAAFRPAGSFEAKSRTKEGNYYVYARYVGPKESASRVNGSPDGGDA
ncbi:hypothetical protein [Streptomyces sp. LPB2020-019-1HS]|uniref:hypothetical protein n=1 Tax=Streptomyces sp. LPB2020-019-1HS TaxID=3409689 RepID=UPI003B67D2B2